MARRSRAHGTDDNQAGIVDALRSMFVSVAVTSGVGDGFPDIVVGHQRVNYLFEIKNPEQPPSKRRLTDDEQSFHSGWRGQIHTVETIEDILSVIHEKREV